VSASATNVTVLDANQVLLLAVASILGCLLLHLTNSEQKKHRLMYSAGLDQLSVFASFAQSFDSGYLGTLVASVNRVPDCRCLHVSSLSSWRLHAVLEMDVYVRLFNLS
jgi:hypothetical protein